MAAITSAVIGGVGLASSLVGGRQARKDQRRATEAQLQGQQQAIASQEAAALRGEELSRPFTEFGTGQLPALQGALQQPTQAEQFATLQASPLFQAAQAEGRRGIRGNLANRGLIGSGQESDLLQNRLLLNAAPLLQNQQQQRQQNIQNLFGATGLGQASAVGQAANIFGTAANVGNIQQGQGLTAGQGIENVANIRQGGIEDVISQLPGAATRISRLFTPPPPVDPFFNQEFGFDQGVGDPFAVGGL